VILDANRRRLAAACHQAAAALPSAATKTPTVYHRLRLDAADGCVVVTCQDTERGLRIRVPETTVKQSGSVLLPAKAVRAMLESDADTASIQVDRKQATLTLGGSRFQFPAEDAEVYPALATPRFTASATITAANLARMIRLTQFAAAKEEVGAKFTTQCLGITLGSTVTMAAGDGRRLALAQAPAIASESTAGPSRYLVPPSVMRLLSPMLADPKGVVRIEAQDATIRFSTDAAILQSRLAEGRFLDVESLFRRFRQAAHRHLTIPVNPLRSFVRLSSPFATDERPATTVGVGEWPHDNGSLRRGLHLLTQSEEGQAEHWLDGMPPEFAQAFQTDVQAILLLGILEALHAERIESFEAGLIDADSPILFRAGDGFQAMLMPLQSSGQSPTTKES
jgi:DNA polymerase III sliding clamp (beta) subunit (PCNA family)